MAWQFPIASFPPLLAAILEVVLAVVLLRAGRGRRATAALALLLLSNASASTLVFVFGGFSGTYETAVAITWTYAFWVLGGAFWICFGANLLAERTRVPRALASFPIVLVPALLLVTLALLRPELVFDFTPYLATPLAVDAAPGSFPFSHPRGLALALEVLGLARPIVAGLLAWWALRREPTEEWSSILLVAIAAGGAYLINAAGIIEPLEATASAYLWGQRLAYVMGAVVSLVVLLFLIREGLQGRVERRPLARMGAGFMVIMWLAGCAIALADWRPIVLAAYLGLAALPFPVIATYALLRHRLLGLDVKVRFALSRSTVAAVFIAVFFLASEAAQQFFGAQFGSAYVGIAAAGMLVFALAPLQRAAERLAEKAVPVTPEDRAQPTGRVARGEESYRQAVRLALRDRRLSREEEGHLHELARDLGIDGARAHAIIVEVERRAEAR